MKHAHNVFMSLSVYSLRAVVAATAPRTKRRGLSAEGEGYTRRGLSAEGEGYSLRARATR